MNFLRYLFKMAKKTRRKRLSDKTAVLKSNKIQKTNKFEFNFNKEKYQVKFNFLEKLYGTKFCLKVFKFVLFSRFSDVESKKAKPADRWYLVGKPSKKERKP